MDRSALPAPDYSHFSLATMYVAPRTLVEEALAEIWSNVLMVQDIGVLDDFFELGGHSLLATQLISRIRNTFHIKLPLRVLFDQATIAGLARNVERSIQLGGEVAMPITPVTVDGLLPLSFAEQRLWFIAQFDNCNSAYNLFAALSLVGQLNVEVLERCVDEVARRHDVLRTRFSIINGAAGANHRPDSATGVETDQSERPSGRSAGAYGPADYRRGDQPAVRPG